MSRNLAAGRAICFFLLVVVAALAQPSALAQDGPPAPQSLAELWQLNDDTYAFRGGRYVSLFITTDEGVIVVDPIGGGRTNRGNPAALKAAIAMVTDQPVRYMVYSHSAQDHGTGGDVFADTAEFVGHRSTAEALAARNDPRTPVPTMVFEESLDLQLGGKSVQLRWAGLPGEESYITVRYRNLLMAVDNLDVRSLPFSDLPRASAERMVEFIESVEADTGWDTFLYGHSADRDISGTRDNVREYREYFLDLTAAMRAAREAGLADNSDEMLAAVRAALAPRYGGWGGFPNGLVANIRGVIRWWSQ